MGEYYIGRPDELYHYGVKGMRWGVRHDPERSGNNRSSRKGMSTAKKVAIGVGVAAAVAGVTYVAVTKRNNGLARAAVSKALRAHGGRPIKSENIKRGPTRAIMEFNESTNGLGSTSYSSKITGTRRAKLTGHSKYRMTKTGQALSNRNRHASKMDQIVRENARRHGSRSEKDWMFDGQPQLRNEYQYHKGEYYRLNKVVNNRVASGKDSFVNTAPVNKLRRQKGPKSLRRH